MIQLLLPLIAILTIAWFFGAYRKGTPAARKRLVGWFFFGVLLVGIVFLTVTGRLHFIAAIVTALLPFVKKLIPVLRYVPLLRRFVKQQKSSAEQTGGESGGDSGADSRGNNAGSMSKAQAHEVLGVKPGASSQQIIDAHRKLMQKCHPDRGGNDYLAAQINQAKDTLLS